jgi:hypothetical protein
MLDDTTVLERALAILRECQEEKEGVAQEA